MARSKNPDWPHELAGALGSLAIQFAQSDFVFGHLVGFAEQLDKTVLYREVLTMPPSEKIKRLRRYAAARTDDVGRLYSAICDSFEEVVEGRNRLIHAYWYRYQDDPNKFMFIDIHGKMDRLSKEIHTCTLEEVQNVGISCGVQVHNLQILRACEETAAFFAYYVPPESAEIPNTEPRKVPFRHSTES